MNTALRRRERERENFLRARARRQRDRVARARRAFREWRAGVLNAGRAVAPAPEGPPAMVKSTTRFL